MYRTNQQPGASRASVLARQDHKSRCRTRHPYHRAVTIVSADQAAWTTAASASATTDGQVYASADSGDNWAAIVRGLPAVLSVEVQTPA
jgi:hypothetical protein